MLTEIIECVSTDKGKSFYKTLFGYMSEIQINIVHAIVAKLKRNSTLATQNWLRARREYVEMKLKMISVLMLCECIHTQDGKSIVTLSLLQQEK